MTPNDVSERLKEIGPHVWYRGAHTSGSGTKINTEIVGEEPTSHLHLFVVSEKPRTEPGWFKGKFAQCAFHGDADDGDIPTTPEELASVIPEGIARFNGAPRGQMTIEGNGFYGVYDQIKRSR